MSIIALSVRTSTGQVLTDLKLKGTSNISQLFQSFQAVRNLETKITTDLASPAPQFEVEDLADCVSVRKDLMKTVLDTLAESIQLYSEFTYTDKEAVYALRSKLL